MALNKWLVVVNARKMKLQKAEAASLPLAGVAPAIPGGLQGWSNKHLKHQHKNGENMDKMDTFNKFLNHCGSISFFLLGTLFEAHSWGTNGPMGLSWLSSLDPVLFLALQGQLQSLSLIVRTQQVLSQIPRVLNTNPGIHWKVCHHALLKVVKSNTWGFPKIMASPPSSSIFWLGLSLTKTIHNVFGDLPWIQRFQAAAVVHWPFPGQPSPCFGWAVCPSPDLRTRWKRMSFSHEILGKIAKHMVNRRISGTSWRIWWVFPRHRDTGKVCLASMEGQRFWVDSPSLVPSASKEEELYHSNVVNPIINHPFFEVCHWALSNGMM